LISVRIIQQKRRSFSPKFTGIAGVGFNGGLEALCYGLNV
jgi:hypothetical protein